MARALPLVLFLTLWHLICAGNKQRTFLFSTPELVARRFLSDVLDGVLIRHSAVTASEAVTGFVLATVAGTIIGLVLATSNRVSGIIAPYLRVLGAVPVYALAPMTVIWFGIGFWQKVGIAFLSAVFVATNQAFQGASYPPNEQMLLFRTFRASWWQILWRLRLPVAFSWVATGCRLNVGFALLGAFLGEIISAHEGLGHYIVKSSSLYDVAGVLSGILGLIIIAYSMDRVVLWLFQRPAFSNSLTLY